MRLYEEPLRADQEHERVATAIEEVRSSLQGTFHGDLLGPADPAYADARLIWNGMVARSPGLIARCTDVADVQAAVRAGATTGVLAALRFGGAQPCRLQHL